MPTPPRQACCNPARRLQATVPRACHAVASDGSHPSPRCRTPVPSADRLLYCRRASSRRLWTWLHPAELDPIASIPFCGSDGGGVLLVRRGGSSPEEAGAVDGGALEVGCAGGAAGVSFDGFRVSRGGWSALSIPAGTLSALGMSLLTSDPVGTQLPVPSHGFCVLAALLCRALLTVNSPNELPAREASYTVPDSSAMGTGSAL